MPLSGPGAIIGDCADCCDCSLFTDDCLMVMIMVCVTGACCATMAGASGIFDTPPPPQRMDRRVGIRPSEQTLENRVRKLEKMLAEKAE
jgi:hypothetical protein